MSSEFKAIIEDYSNIQSPDDSQFNLNRRIFHLDGMLISYINSPRDDNTKNALKRNLRVITDYYTNVRDLNTRVRKYLNKTSKKISNAQDTLVNEIRYEDRVRPEETTVSREVMYGIFPKFRESTLPYVLSAGVFMALLTIFLVLQALGFNSQVTLPQALIGFFVSPAGTVSVPFYKNPMVLGGLVAILGTALIIFIIMYFNKKS
jgi:hypothetical protein